MDTDYKGIFFGKETKQFYSPKTGAHFNFKSMCDILNDIR
jgi:hypothetical protein